MAPGVRDAFRTLFREHTPDGLVRDGRYIEDVYATG
jgi:cytochrome P450/NADPH-cytochrome P450 reductase